MNFTYVCPTCYEKFATEKVYDRHACPGRYKEDERPPIGIMPRFLWEEQRAHALSGAIVRFAEKGRPIPIEWIEEYNELTSRVGKRVT